MALTDLLQQMGVQGASAFTGATEGQSADATQQTDETTGTTDPYANIKSSDILAKFYEQSGQKVPAIPSETAKLTGADYYPTENFNPQGLKVLPGGGSLPYTVITTGGAPIYPFAVRDARRKAINDAAYQQALMYQNKLGEVAKKYQKQGTYAPYQQQYDDEMNGIQDEMQSYIKQNGMGGINDLMNPDSEISQKLDDKYYKLKAYGVNAQQADQYATELQKQLAEGKYISPSTQQSLKDFREGDFQLEKLPTVMGNMAAYAGFDTLFKDSPLLNTDEIQATVSTLKDANGKPIAATDKEKAYLLTSKQLVSDDTVNKRLQYIRDNYPQYKEVSDSAIKDYIKTNAKQDIKATVEKMENFEGKKDETVEPQSGAMVNIATKSASGDPSVQAFAPIRSWDISKTNNAPKGVTIKQPAVLYNVQNNQQEKGGSGSMVVDIVSVDELPLTNGTNKIADKSMYDENPNGFHLEKMALVTEPQPEDELTKTRPPAKQYYVPYDNVKQPLENSKVNLNGINEQSAKEKTATIKPIPIRPDGTVNTDDLTVGQSYLHNGVNYIWNGAKMVKQ